MVYLVIMIAKAEKDRDLLMMLGNLIARRSNQNSLRMLEQVVMPENNGGHDLNAAPYRYAIVAQVLDFDDDGYLSATEYQRGQVAMDFPSL